MIFGHENSVPIENLGTILLCEHFWLCKKDEQEITSLLCWAELSWKHIW